MPARSMLDGLRTAGIRNYTIYRSGNEMFGYFESDDLEQAAEYLAGRRRGAAAPDRARSDRFRGKAPIAHDAYAMLWQIEDSLGRSPLPVPARRKERL
ncbi:MAG TPA: L-rhamnose mutarotase [Solirubrobacteraceae bacterium]|nr:L-rhamnose mutarotase [Solirubrobacteraceae bacterium]